MIRQYHLFHAGLSHYLGCLKKSVKSGEVTVGGRGDFRGVQGGGVPLLQCLLSLGGSAPLKLLHWLGFSEFIGLASKVL